MYEMPQMKACITPWTTGWFTYYCVDLFMFLSDYPDSVAHLQSSNNSDWFLCVLLSALSTFKFTSMCTDHKKYMQVGNAMFVGLAFLIVQFPIQVPMSSLIYLFLSSALISYAEVKGMISIINIVSSVEKFFPHYCCCF